MVELRKLLIKWKSAYGYDTIATKKAFKRAGLNLLKKLKVDIPFIECEISFNPGGPAVSGDCSLMGMINETEGVHVFFNIDGICPWITYRTISSMKDYSGGMNHQCNFDETYTNLIGKIMYLLNI